MRETEPSPDNRWMDPKTDDRFGPAQKSNDIYAWFVIGLFCGLLLSAVL